MWELTADQINEREISSHQKTYRKFANSKIISAKEEIQTKNIQKNLEHIENELEELNTNLTGTKSSVYCTNLKNSLEKIAQSVWCIENLKLKLSSTNYEVQKILLQIGRLAQEAVHLNKQTIPDNLFESNTKQATRNAERLENRLNDVLKKENSLVMINASLRIAAKQVLEERMLFNYLYKRMVNRLSRDKILLADMVDQAVLAYNTGSDLCKRIKMVKKKAAEDEHFHVNEMLDLMLRINVDDKKETYFTNKGNNIIINELDPGECMRRNVLKSKKRDTSILYESILDRVKNFTGEENTLDAIENFKNNRRLYFSHFTYLNELNLHMDRIMGAFHQSSNAENVEENTTQHNYLDFLMSKFKMEANNASKGQGYIDTLHNQLDVYFNQIKELSRHFVQTSDSNTLDDINGDVKIHNYEEYLSTIESKIKKAIGYVFFNERQKRKDPNYLIQNTEVTKVAKSQLSDPNLMHECPECAVTEHVNQNMKNKCLPLEKADIITAINQKKEAPEMLYRMHNLSKCTLPRCRALYINKNS